MIQLSLSADKTLVIETSVVTLRGMQPVLNGTLLENCTCEALPLNSDQIELHYTSSSLGGGTFGLKATQPNSQGHSWIQYWVEGLPKDLVLDSFGLCFEQVENVRQFLRSGYFSWDASYYVQPATRPENAGDGSHLETGYAMCQFLPRYGGGSLIIGFDRHDRFQQTFTFDLSHRPISLTIQTLWDRKDCSGLDQCESERLVIFTHAEIENGLREWARRARRGCRLDPSLHVQRDHPLCDGLRRFLPRPEVPIPHGSSQSPCRL